MVLTKDEYKEMIMLMEQRDVTESYSVKDLIRLHHLELKSNDSQLDKAIKYINMALSSMNKTTE